METAQNQSGTVYWHGEFGPHTNAVEQYHPKKNQSLDSIKQMSF